jgi:predicted secreted protein
MTTSAFWAYGSALQIGDGAASEAFTSIAEISELTPPSMSRDAIEVTTMGSTSGFREFIPGWRDGGEVSIVANWLPTDTTHDGTTGLLESYLDDDEHNWRIVLPDSLATIAFTGFITAFEPDLPLEEQGKLSCTIKLTGVPTVTT